MILKLVGEEATSDDLVLHQAHTQISCSYKKELQKITKVGLNITGDKILHTLKRIGQGEGETYRTYEIDNLLEISIACMMTLVSSIIITWRV